MSSIALLHTVKSVYEDFGPRLIQKISGLTVYNLLDDFLALDANRRGEFTANNFERLKHDLASLDATGSDAIVVTCSTLTPWLPKAVKGMVRPVFAIDDAMTTKAARRGGRVAVMATALSAIDPIREVITRKASKFGTRVELSTVTCLDAMTALRAGDKVCHDKLLLEAARTIIGADLIVLAQASMAHMDKAIADVCGCETLQSIELCMEQVAEFLKGKSTCTKGDCP